MRPSDSNKQPRWSISMQDKVCLDRNKHHLEWPAPLLSALRMNVASYR
jgi:hypothetical protein